MSHYVADKVRETELTLRSHFKGLMARPWVGSRRIATNIHSLAGSQGGSHKEKTFPLSSTFKWQNGARRQTTAPPGDRGEGRKISVTTPEPGGHGALTTCMDV